MARCNNKLEKYNKNSKYFDKTKSTKKSRNIKFYGVLNIEWMLNDVWITTRNDDGREKKIGHRRDKKVADKKSIKSFLKKSGGQLKEGFN